MEIEIKSREDLISLLRWSLADAPILNDDLLKKWREFSSEIDTVLTVTDDGIISDDPNHRMQPIDIKIADYLFNQFEKIVVSKDEKLIGVKNNQRIELYDGDDRKLYLDASML